MKKEWLEKFEETLRENGICENVWSEEEKPLDLPCQCTIEHVAKMLSGKDTNGNCLTIPPVQRGKVWNAARIETLWDSIFRNIPIGALSVRRKGAESKEYDLLDGQQRSTAIELGYSDFPQKDEEGTRYNLILWIDLEKKDGHYRFYVTTAAHPWGYASSGDETKNVRLSLYEQRTAAKEIELEEAQVKPYPCQLYPVRASIPVPYTLLRKCVEGKVAYDASFVDSLKNALKLVGVHKQVLQKLEKCSLSEIEELFTKVKGVHDYTVTLLDASSVAESDIALYFTRIGKGGVVPSNEELAYSVLKAKLDSGFRETIEEIRDEYGLATSPRIAALAIRLFKSNEKDFYTGSVFDAVGEMCRSREAGETLERDRFLEFVTKDFKGFVKSVCSEGGLTRWHLTRYAMGRNGDVFLMLLLEAKLKKCGISVFKGVNAKGLAALIFNFSSYPDYAIKKILREGVRVGAARLTEEWKYRSQQLNLPIPPEEYSELEMGDFSLEKLESWKVDHPHAAEFLGRGYGDGLATDILIYACRDSKKNRQFGYDPNLGVWSEESCPWDYDHIMPHSTIEKMAKSKGKEICEWLKDSVGNLAPIPFSLNRSLSDSPRTNDYPFCNGENKDAEEQKALGLVEPDSTCNLKEMWCEDGTVNSLAFCRQTVRRFVRLYKRWYDELGIADILDFKKTIDAEDVPSISQRYRVLKTVKEALSSEVGEKFSLRMIVAEDKEAVISEADLYRALCAKDDITLSQEVNGFSIAITKNQREDFWEVGLRKSCSESSASDVTRKLILQASEYEGLGNTEECKWWYLYDKVDGCKTDGSRREEREVEEELTERMKRLLAFAQCVKLMVSAQ